jgi:PAS domain S-box-containing protein
MLDVDGRVASWNVGAERIKGYSRAEIIGCHFSKFYTEADATAGLPARALHEAMTKGRFESEGWRVRKDGTRFWANVVVDAIRDDQGQLLGYAKITRDVTEKRAAQIELDAAREALFQSQKMDAIGQLTGGVAHDFNNLLAAILGSLSIARKRMSADPKVDPLIDNAIHAAERGAALTKRMLAFARKQELETRAVDLPELVSGLTELLQRSLGPGVLIDTRFPPDLERVAADSNQLELALLNLSVNARDAMPDGGRLLIGAHAEQADKDHRTGLSPGRYVCLSVTDTGQGMDEETLAHATEPFFTTKGVGKGTGLGLSMVHGLSEQSGGRFVLTSEKGRGTRAEIWLPVADLDDRAVVAPAAGPSARGKKMTVLAVDDDALVLMNTATMLEELGHDVIEASSGRRALEVLHENPDIDLVVTDQAMPGMTGSQLATAIKANWPMLPIILATGYSELPPDGDPSLPRLSKPFGERELADKIRLTAAGTIS